MKKAIIAACSILLISCVSYQEYEGVLERKFLESDGISPELYFSVARGFPSKPKKEFVLWGDNILAYYKREKTGESYGEYRISDCLELKVAVENLRSAVKLSASVISGLQPLPERKYIALDGYEYSLHWREPNAGMLQLDGDSNSYQYARWMKAAEQVIEEAGKCDKAAK